MYVIFSPGHSEDTTHVFDESHEHGVVSDKTHYSHIRDYDSLKENVIEIFPLIDEVIRLERQYY